MRDRAQSGQTHRDWYRADLQAQEVFASLRSGDVPAGVEQADTLYRYCVPISGNRVLEVAVKEETNGWVVLRWQTVAQPEEINKTLPAWQG